MVSRSSNRHLLGGSALPPLRPPSSAQPIATPLGPALAVAVTYWVPELVDAVVGPDRLSCTGLLSTLTVSAGALTTPAALVPASVSASGPLVAT